MASRPNRLTDGALRSERQPTALASTDVDVDFTTRRNRPLLSPTGDSPQVMNNSEAVGVSNAVINSYPTYTVLNGMLLFVICSVK